MIMAGRTKDNHAFIADDCAFDPRENAPTMTVIEADKWIDTGLLDAAGNRIYRARAAIGFRGC